MALDMVRLEWAHIEAFDNAAEKALGPEDLLELGPNFRAGVQPYVRLLDLQYPVDDLRIHVNRASDERGAVEQRGSRSRRIATSDKTSSRLKLERVFLAVHRVDFSGLLSKNPRRRISPARCLRDGQPIGKAIWIRI